MASSGCSKETSSSNPSSAVRIITRIRGFTNREREIKKSSSKPWISIQKPEGESSEAVTLSFGGQSSSQKESCTVHYCYEHEEGTDFIYTREIKPLVSGVFDGRDATVVAYGAIASGKTFTIQGSAKKPGLAILAMDEIISTAEMLGKSVMISLYEIYQEQVYDLLNPARPAIMVMEDAWGRIQLKGLSQAPVKSVSEFCKIYLSASRSQKAVLKPQTELSRRSHKGLIVHLVTPNTSSGPSHVSKLNFIDLAGYMDPRRKGNDGARILENNLLNRSLYALQKVVLALTSNESYVPFRESKITRMLQDSLGGVNKLLLVACLNPSFCQDSVYMANLAGRTFQGLNQSITGSMKQTKSSNRIPTFSSCKTRTPLSTSASTRKQTGSQVHALIKKISGTPVVNRKKLFDEAGSSKKLTKTTPTPIVVSAAETKTNNEPTLTVPASLTATASPMEDENFSADYGKETLHLEVGKFSVDSVKEETLPLEEVSHDTYLKSMSNQVDLPSDVNCFSEAFSLIKEDDSTDTEKRTPSIDMDRSPPIFARLREISNYLKLVDSTPTCIELSQQKDLPCESQVSAEPEDFEPKTPIFECRKENEKLYLNTPREVSNTSYHGSKNSLVQEYLRFVNSASKEELMGLKGIGEKRATYILELREESPEPFKSLDDLKDIGLSAKQIKGMFAMK
ncbi:hypothetical protein SAY86_018267 [Trapa natans]|uniref:Kinesin motor domain-containing protein n=1 Tax=Trapa natans TaxID=22666 RepID=A0AAN7LGK4_TRANT|nr:hypothetical protein SAY86_018267 [Trapa natans]